MRTVLAAMVVLGAVIVVASIATLPGEVLGQQRPAPQQADPAGSLIAFCVPTGEAKQQQVVTVIDPKQRSMGIYHVELATGEITLKSVRNIQYDLQMMDFNGTDPLPREVRAVLESKQP